MMSFRVWFNVLIVLQFSSQVSGLTFTDGATASATVIEGAAINSTVRTLSLTGAGPIELVVLNSDYLDYFRVEKNDTALTISILVNQDLDYEGMGKFIEDNGHPFLTGAKFQVTIQASGGSGNDIIHVTISVLNDQQCSFTLNADDVSILEQSSTNVQQFYRVQHPLVPYGIIKYVIDTANSSADALSKFEINDPYNGQISIKSGTALDSEVAKTYSLYVRCEVFVGTSTFESGSYLELQVHVIDINDNTNVFQQPSYSFNVDENAANGFVFGNVSATDADSTTANSATYYSVLGNQFSNMFSLNSTTGILSSAGNLDYEAGAMYYLTICATDDATAIGQNAPTANIRSACVPVTISLNDLNDNPPTFSASSFAVSVSEKVPIGHKLFTFSASDADSGLNKQVEYKAVNMNSSLFSLDASTGVVNVTGALNYETLTSHTIVVYAEDKGSSSMKSVNVTLTVSVTDVNDLNPVFQQQVYRFNVSENTDGFLATILATDGDGTAPNSNLVYTGFDPDNGTVLIFHSNGSIFITPNGGSNTLDREMKSQYEFLYIASDSSTDDTERRFATTLIILEINDVNDNPPVFAETAGSILISEQIPLASSIYQFSATDKDSSSVVTYHKSDTADPDWAYFILNETTGVITTNATYNYNTKNFYQVHVVARDGNFDSVIAYLNISIADTDKEALVFDLDRYTYNQVEGAQFTFLQITTPEIPRATGGGNVLSTVQYHIVPHAKTEEYFRIDSSTGNIYPLKKFDFEQERYFAFEIVAMDTSGQYLNATALIIVDVKDIVDVNPVLYISSESVSIPEDSTVGQIVAVLRVDDVDTESELSGGMTYTIVDNATSSSNVPFQIMKLNETTAYIVVSQMLDYETKDMYSVRVSVSDSQDNRGNTITVNINVADVNDNNPKFPHSLYTFNVADNLVNGTDIGTVNATDADGTSINKDLQYSLFDPDGKYQFAIDPNTGKITVASTLTVQQDTTYTYKVYAKDLINATDATARRMGSTLVRFNVQRTANDPPVMFPDFDTIVISEKFLTNSVVYTARATDRENDIIIYQYSKNDTSNPDNKYFNVQPNGNLVINTNNFNDREHKSDYTLYIQAKELLTSKVSSNELRLIIKVEDVNDNSPKFDKALYNFTVQENSAAGTVFGQVHAVDADSTKANNQTYYVLGSTKYANLFAVNVATGELSVTGNLDRETQSIYYINIIATDNVTDADEGVPSNEARVGTTLVEIQILDQNDNAPMFSTNSYYVLVSEKVPIGHKLFTFSASDADSGLNKQVEYKVVSMNSSLFSLDPTTGAVDVIGALDYEAATSHTIVVYAEDKGFSSMKSVNVTLTVSVADVNDLNPVFPQEVYRFNVTENTHGFLTKVFATDDDGTTINNNLVYTGIDPFKTGILTFDSSGNITVNPNTLDREKGSQYEFLVVATDTANDERKSSAMLILNVIDVNDNAPVITPTSYTISISQFTPTMSSIFDFDATDADVSSMVTFAATDPSNSVWNTFKLNATNGDITTISNVNTLSDSYTLQVHATDGLHNSSIGTLTVNIVKANNTLQFVSDRYHYSIDEKFPVGIFVEIGLIEANRVRAISPDQNTVIKYSIVKDTLKNSTDFFRIDENTGQIYLTKSVDFETTRYYSFMVKATDPSGKYFTSDTLVVVDILDVIDVPPTLYTVCFDQNPCQSGTFNLTENPADGEVAAVLYAVDVDTETELSGGLRYIISDTSVPFQIMSSANQKTAYIVVSNPSAIDREQASEYKFNVSTKDGGDYSSNNVEITISIIDLNDNNPIFREPSGYVFPEYESSAPSTVIGTVRADDLDATSPNKDITYSVMGSEAGNIIINPTTGQITINSSTDYEFMKHYDFMVIATDNASPEPYRRKTAVPVRIDILDINDNAPQFTGPSSFTIYEDVAPSTTVFTITATDADSQLNGLFTFSSPMSSPFLISPYGVVSVSGNLDYESTQVYTMTIIANDTYGLVSTRNITIYINNVDDNTPKFGQPLGYAISISEATIPGNNSDILNVNATDADLNTFNKISYSIINPFKNIPTSNVFPFKINSNTGVISLAYPVDRESRDMYQFIVKATDDGNPPLTSVVFVNVTITDENDNSPIFSASWYNVTISDATVVGGTVRVVTASDIDAGMNGEIVYSLNDPTGHFAINSASGAIYVANHLYYKTQNSYTFQVVATDKGTPSRNGTAMVAIELSAMKNYPTTVSDISINEISAVVGTKLVLADMMMLAVADQPTYEIEFISQRNSSSYFRIESTDGSVYLTRNLDYETMKEHTFIRKAVVNGHVIIGEETVYVHVLDANDNSPYFAPKSIAQVVSISEDSEIGQIVAIFNGYDPDESAKLTFSIPPVQGYSFGQTSVNGTHVLFLTGELDAEFSQQVVLDVFLNDGKNIVQTTLTVNIIDENDHSPMFNATEYTFQKVEGVVASNYVGRVFATDKDVTTFRNTVNYRILDTDVQSVFSIYSNGTIVCKEDLDREMIAIYEFTVEAFNTDMNNSRTGVAMVTVNVLDINDNSPVYQGPKTYTFYENEPLGSILFVANATDADAGENGRLSYRIVSNGGMPIAIDPVTGTVRLQGTLDYETSQNHVVQVEVSDNGSPSRNATRSYFINILDVNDNKPVFTIRPALKYTKTISENIAIGSAVIQTDATDSDTGENGRITYSIYQSFGNIPFNISSNGLISTSGPIDREQQHFYQFFIQASDNGSPSLFDTILVEITISDQNDNSPMFKQLYYDISLAEGTPMGFSVLQVAASDADAGVFGQVTYSIHNQTDSGIFRLANDTGILSTTQKIRIAPASYRIIATAQDRDPANPRSAPVPVVIDIKILPLDVITPQFTTNYQTFSVIENTHTPYSVGTTFATGNGISYSIVYDDQYRPNARKFVVTRRGSIFLLESLDYEQVQSLSYTIMATNIYNNNATQNIFVKILDADDNRPEWAPANKTNNGQIMSVTITDESRVGQIVATVAATDKDTVSQNKLKFTLVNDHNNKFNIISYQDVGRIVVNGDLRFPPITYRLEVEVEDPIGNKALTRCVIDVSVVRPDLPQFKLSSYQFQATEDRSSGQFVGTVAATGVPDMRYYMLINNGNIASSNGVFSINEISGTITTATTLNLESNSYHDFTVVASEKDSIRRAMATVRVIVLPSNEYAPVFTSPTAYHVSEFITVPSDFIYLHARDSDAVFNKITYSFVNSTLPLNLAVNSTTGVVTYRGGFNFEVANVVYITFMASDNGTPTKSTYHKVSVFIKNINEYNPVFSIRLNGQSTYNAQKPENLAPGSPIIQVHATDSDAGVFGEIEYKLADTQQAHPFAINQQTGLIFLRSDQALDYESRNYYELLAIAQDKGSPVRSDSAVVAIQITDVNDNLPVFNPHIYHLTMSDNTPVGRTLSRVYATDRDAAPNNNIAYSITTGNSLNHFSINSASGELILSKAINYRNLNERSFTLTVAASDGANRFSLIQGTVYISVVQSVIPKPPYFITEQNVVSFKEDQDLTMLITTEAVNPTGDPLTFTILNNTLIPDEDNFAASRTRGNLFLIKKLDYETQVRHDFEMKATCSGSGLFGLATFTIYVQDVNDNPPYFEAPRAKTIQINEKSNSGQEVTRVEAKDLDSVSRNNLFYRINTPNIPFVLVNTGSHGIIYVNGDLEKLGPSLYTLEITVFDKYPSGKLQFEAAQKYYLTINVTRNDKRYPTFDKASYAFSVQENNNAQQYLGRVFTNGGDTFSLSNAGGRFSINQNGEIHTQRSFNAEVETVYDFTVVAKNPVNNFASFAPVRVTIINVNDVIPQFVGPFLYNVSESKPTGSFLFYANVVDGDVVPASKSFRVKSQSPQLGVSINENTGYVYLTGSLDYETNIKHSIEIEVRDGESPNLQVNSQVFTIHVINENEHNPVFRHEILSVSVDEGKAGSHLLTLEATDNDAGVFGEITYRIRSPLQNLPFAINPRSGKFYLTGSLDYEKIKEYHIYAFADDGGVPPRMGVSRVHITVLDDNDNVPVFDAATYDASVVEVAPVGTSIIQVHATDIDSDKFNVVSYQLASGNSNLFRIESASGIIYTKAALNYETATSHQLIISAVDAKKPNQSPSQATVRISVLDVNEDQPTFATPIKNIDVFENTAVNSRIGNTQAVDTDATFKTISYSIQQAGDYADFSIVSNTGEIKLARPLNYELKKTHSFTVVATDNGGLKGRQTVIVNVKDVNDNVPRFVNPVNQSYVVSTEVPTGQVIAMINAADDDSVSKGKLSMRVVNANSPFEVSTSNDMGYVSLRQGFKLALGTYVVEVSVSDGQFSSVQNAFISIRVRHPAGVQVQFRKPEGDTFRVNENAQNHVFGSVDAIVKDNLAPISYRIWELNNGSIPFKISSTSGLLSQNGNFDYEAVRDYLFHVVAETTYDGVLYQAIASVYVIIDDVNDNKPVFDGPSSITVHEEIQVGEGFYTVLATDGDALNTPNSQVQYSISGSDKFTIGATNGVLSAIQALDYETEKSYQVKVRAFDKGVPTQSAERTYTINVLDSNDNRPSFAKSFYKASVREDVHAQERIICVEATDADTGENEKITYELISAETANTQHFASSTTGCIFYIGPNKGLDRETKDRYEFFLKATDKGTPALIGLTRIVIEILDVNDNSPLFANSLYNLQLADTTSSGTEIIRLSAADADAGTNGEIVYSIVNGNLANAFQLLQNGQLKTAIALNLDTTPDKYKLTIKAEDKAPASVRRSSEITVNIDVIEASKFIAPMFSQSSYTANITEAQATGVSFLKVQANLANAVVGYEIIDCSVKTAGKIQINANGEISLLQQLDYEQVQTSSFFVKAIDQANPKGGYSTALITIRISDVNDERPVFQRTRYETSFARDSKIGAVIANVYATDADSVNNGIVRYEFVPNSQHTDLFAINTVTGDITLKKVLAKGDIRNYQMDVRSYDLGTPQLSSKSPAIVVINIYPDNMFKPTITNQQQLSFSIPENQAVNSLVVTVLAEDGDSNPLPQTLVERPEAGNFGKFTFNILPTQEAIPFVINAANGQIQLASALDRETKPTYQFYVQVRDGGTPFRSSTAKVFITITDINEPPQFKDLQYSVTVSEATPRDVSIARVYAVDNDLGANGELAYSIASGNIGNKFSIDNTGVIKLIDLLDFETTPSYVLKVKISDGKLSAAQDATVTVTVANAPEGGNGSGPPVFELSYYSFDRPENSGTVTLAAIKATASDGGTVSFSMTPEGDSTYFAITSNGALTFKGGDYETQNDYTGVIKATSSANTNSFSNAVVRVRLTDVNDNTPIVVNPNAVVSIREDASISSRVYTVYATDLDSGLNGNLIYTFQAASSVFAIDSKTGVVTLKSALDRETKDSYTLIIIVSDKGTPAKSALQSLTVNVFDQNDNNPTPTNGKVTDTISIPQSTEVRSTVYTVLYDDADLGDNGKVEYVMAGADFYFAVALDGKITLKNPLALVDRDYFVYVIAQDKGTPSRKSPFTLKVTVKTGNQTGPSFNPTSYTFQTSEDVGVDSIIGHLNIIDSDFFQDSYIYNIKSGNTNSAFTVLNNGNVQVKKGLDREVTSAYTLTVSVTDQSGNVASLDATVVIQVTDVNDNNPVFLQTPYEFAVLENSPVGSSLTGPFLFTIRANDADIGANGQFDFSLIDSTNTFKINGNGQIYLAKQVDYATKKKYDILVIARDQGSTRRSSTEPVTITVTDINEPPFFQPSKYTASISEMAHALSSVISLNVVDNDSGPVNNAVTLSITSGNDGGKFGIEGHTIKLIANLDYESVNRYNLSISARDSGANRLNALVNAEVIIDVTNANDNQPQFMNTPYRTSVDENTTPGFLVLTVSASDRDNAGSISYSLDGSDDSKAFNILTEGGSGKIYVKSSLDYETKKQYSFNVLANDNNNRNALTAKALVEININDVNDNRPVFKNSSYTYSINDQSPIGIIVGSFLATDADSGVFAQTEYFFSGGDISNFQLQDTYLVLKNTLDYTKKSQYILQIGALDKQSSLQASTQATIVVKVQQTQGTPPKFSQSFYNVTVFDSITVFDVIATVNAVDNDGAGYSAVTYSLVPSLDSKLFRIDSSTGQIRLQVGQSLSAKNQLRHVLIVNAVDNIGLSTQTYVILHVVGVATNSEYPTFLVTNYFGIATDRMKAGASIVTVFAVTSSNDRLTYSIASGNSDNLFTLSPNGNLQLRTPFTYDAARPTSYLLKINATSTVSNLVSKESAVVDVTIHYLSPASPSFSAPSYSTSLNENQAPLVVMQVSATFRNTNEQGEVRYRIIYNDQVKVQDFIIDATNGKISSVRNFNREVKDSYVFQVEAFNSASQSNGDKALVTININDLNDNKPIFSSPANDLHEVSVLENAPIGTQVFCVKASDIDIGANGQIEYYLDAGAGRFSIDSATGVIKTAQVLDHEGAATMYTIRAGARDRGTTPESSTIRIVVKITNVNDVRPSFVGTPYVKSIDEKNSVIPNVIKIEAFDADFNSPMKYKILVNDSASIPFVIDPTTGIISTYKPVDYEVQQTYELQVMAYDSGTPYLSEVAAVTININDVNDNAPVAASETYQASVSEAAPVGSLVIVVKATDADSGLNGKITYSISAGDQGDFAVNANTGEITVKSALNYESISQYTITVQAKDNAVTNPKQLAKSITVTINVLNVNEHAPVVQVAATLTVDEGQTGLVIPNSQITATDGDQGDTVQLSLVNYNEVFEISQNQIKTKIALNYDTQPSYDLVVKGTDSGGLIGVAKVVISVKNNNNAPVFPSNVNYNITVPENQPLESIVGVYLATDQDSGANGQITYQISPSSNKFTYTNGVLRLLSSLDYETGKLYTLTLVAQDGGSPKLSSQVQLTINVGNVNDNAPTFDPAKYESVAGNNGDVSIQVSASDADGDSIAYSIVENAVSNLFTISSSGLVTNVSPLAKDRKSYYFNVKASDSINVGLAEVLVTITGGQCVGNVTGSVVMHATYSISVDESANINNALVTVQANAMGNVGSIQYAIEDASSKFRVDASTGQVFAKSAFNYEKNQEHTVCVSAMSSLDHTIADSTTIRISVNDVNDVPPVFNTDITNYNISYYYRTYAFASISATVPGNFPITYSILSGNTGKWFSIDGTTGALQLDKQLTSTTSYTLKILASTSATMNNTIDVMVTVMTLPAFSRTTYERTLDETRNTGVSILTVQASGSVEYTIADNIADKVFSIDSNGLITNLQVLDFESVRQYSFCVSARDTTTGLINVASVLVKLNDIADLAPRYAGNFSISIPSAWPLRVGFIDPVTVEGFNIAYSLDPPVDGFNINTQTATIAMNKTKSAGTYLLRVKAVNTFGEDFTYVIVTLTSSTFETAALLDVKDEGAGQLDVSLDLTIFFPMGIADDAVFEVYVQPVSVINQPNEDAWLAVTGIRSTSSPTPGRKRRSTGKYVHIKIGTESFCPENTEKACNKRLKSGVKYNIFLKAVQKDGTVGWSSLSKPTTVKPSSPNTESSMSSLIDKSSPNYNYIAGLIVMAVIIVICVAAIAILLCQKSRDHKTIYMDDFVDGANGEPGVARTHINRTYRDEEDSQVSYPIQGHEHVDDASTSMSLRHSPIVAPGRSTFAADTPPSTHKQGEIQEVSMDMEDGQTNQQYFMKPSGESSFEPIPQRPASTTQPRLKRTPSGRVTLQHDFAKQ